ncbi:MAG TPA: LysR substrate-binding domain-containing protein [Eoetvoesiella sp.]|uniref:LysR family transcriptional regulator n=1 Tax=Eoetvoesiella sp. TaxID=1966355 RepID=UPI002B67C55A|nr:LysR substrate-binding domain-containing protein [Eoetvoesiella sp.]HWK61966.1 LysR substrate-binding domain-containing protein [Eoetvoesiella sp.]
MARLDWYIRANLRPRHFQLLVALDELRHVGRVADYLNITQPAVSKSLSELERGLEVRLFERDPKGLIPTAFGECLIRFSRSVLRELNTTRDELRHLKAGTTGSIRIGMLPVAAPALVPRSVILLKEEAPATTVVLVEGNSDSLLPMLQEGKLDIIVGTLPSAPRHTGLELQPLHPGEAIVAVCGTRNPLAGREKITVQDLAGYPLIIPPPDAIFREHVDAIMDYFDMPLPAGAIESGSMTASNTFIRDANAISFYSQHLAQHYSRVSGISILPLKMPPAIVTAPIGVVWPKHVEMPASTRLLIEKLAEVIDSVFDTGVEGQGL